MLNKTNSGMFHDIAAQIWLSFDHVIKIMILSNKNVTPVSEWLNEGHTGLTIHRVFNLSYDGG